MLCRNDVVLKVEKLESPIEITARGFTCMGLSRHIKQFITFFCNTRLLCKTTFYVVVSSLIVHILGYFPKIILVSVQVCIICTYAVLSLEPTSDYQCHLGGRPKSDLQVKSDSLLITHILYGGNPNYFTSS